MVRWCSIVYNGPMINNRFNVVYHLLYLTDKERFFLSKWFMEKVKNEEQMYKEKFKKS
jgi:hypothetical protein